MKGIFFVKFQLCNKSDGFKWALVAVYGPTQPDHKESLLAELVRMCSHENLPLVMGGDYNILRLRKITLITMQGGHYFLMR
jgi:hypothetical protein